MFCENLSPEQALLLAGKAGVDDRAGELVFREDASGFDRCGQAGCVIVRARTIRGRVKGIRDAAVDVAGHHDNSVRIERSALDGDDVDHLGRFGNAPLAFDEIADDDDFEAAAAGRRDPFEFGFHPAPRRADAATVRHRVRKRVPRAEIDQGLNVGGDPFGGNLRCEGVGERVVRRCGGGARVSARARPEDGGARESKGDLNGVHGASL